MTTNTTTQVDSAIETATAITEPARKNATARSAATKAGASPARSKASKPKQAVKPQARRQTRQSKLADMLRRKSGATIPQIVNAFDWQRHTARAAISGLRKRGEPVESTIENAGRVYRINTQ